MKKKVGINTLHSPHSCTHGRGKKGRFGGISSGCTNLSRALREMQVHRERGMPAEIECRLLKTQQHYQVECNVAAESRKRNKKTIGTAVSFATVGLRWARLGFVGMLPREQGTLKGVILFFFFFLFFSTISGGLVRGFCRHGLVLCTKEALVVECVRLKHPTT